MDLMQEMHRQVGLLCAPRTPTHDCLGAVVDAPAAPTVEHTVMSPLEALLTGTTQDLVIALGSAARDEHSTIDFVWRDGIRRLAIEYSGLSPEYVDEQLAELEDEELH